MNDQTRPAIAALTEAISNVVTSASAVSDAANADREAYEQSLADTNGQLLQAQATAASLQQQLDDLRAANDPWFKVDKTGATDVTAAFQKLVANGGVVPEGTYLIDPLRTIKWIGSLDISAAKFHFVPNGAKAYCGFELAHDDNELIGGEITGDRDQHDFTTNPGTHEWGHGVKVTAKRCKWTDTVVRNCTGDGGYIGEGAKDGQVTGVVCDNNRRQGISITDDVENFHLFRCKLLNTNGTSPQAGLDLEPNAGKYTKGIRIEECLISGNGWGVNVKSNRVSGVQIVNCTISGNRSRGMWTAGVDVSLIGGTVAQNGATGVAYAEGSSGKVSGVTFDRNIAKKHANRRATAIVKAGIVPGTENDLVINSKATVDLTEANTYA